MSGWIKEASLTHLLTQVVLPSECWRRNANFGLRPLPLTKRAARKLKFALPHFEFRSRHIRSSVFEKAQPKRTNLACDFPELRA